MTASKRSSSPIYSKCVCIYAIEMYYWMSTGVDSEKMAFGAGESNDEIMKYKRGNEGGY